MSGKGTEGMEADCRVTLRASCASRPDELHTYSRQVPKGTALTELLHGLALEEPFVREFLFNPSEGRLYPYHLLLWKDQMLLPHELDRFTVTQPELELKIVPFVSGG